MFMLMIYLAVAFGFAVAWACTYKSDSLKDTLVGTAVTMLVAMCWPAVLGMGLYAYISKSLSDLD